MEFPDRGAEEGRHHHHHHHHQHPHYFSGQEERRGQEGYPPISSVYEPTHAPADPFAHGTPPGPYGTHGSSGPYYPHPHQERPASGAPFVSELPHPHEAQLPQGQLVRVFCQKNQAFNLAVEHNNVIMKAANTEDEAQQWIKDDSYGTRIRDNYDHPAFSLVNKKTAKILKHSKQKGHQVLLMDYRPNIRDDDILWSESQDFGEGFKTVRCASDTLLNLTVSEGVKTVRNGSPLVLDTWHKGDHQLWKLFPL